MKHALRQRGLERFLAARMPYLEFKLGPDTMLARFLGRIDFVVGRLPRVDVQLRDMAVSRLHAQIFMDSRGAAFVRDLGASGGTFVGGRRITGTEPLMDGVKIRIGQARITFWDRDPPGNAFDPPVRSHPKGLIRFNNRVRPHFAEGEETVLAVNNTPPPDPRVPAEPPPDVHIGDFAEDNAPPVPDIQARMREAEVRAASAPPAQPAQPAQPVKKRTGIIEAPWESGDKKRVPSRKIALPKPRKPLPRGPQHAEDAPETQPAEEHVLSESDFGPAEEFAEEAAEEIVEDLFGDEPPAREFEDQPAPAGSSASSRRRRTITDELMEEMEDSGPNLPTFRVGEQNEAPPPDPAVDQPEGGDGADNTDDEELTEDDVIRFMGGSASGRFEQDINFEESGEVDLDDLDHMAGQESNQGDDPDTLPGREAVQFGPGAARLMKEDSTDTPPVLGFSDESADAPAGRDAEPERKTVPEFADSEASGTSVGTSSDVSTHVARPTPERVTPVPPTASVEDKKRTTRKRLMKARTRDTSVQEADAGRAPRGQDTQRVPFPDDAVPRGDATQRIPPPTGQPTQRVPEPEFPANDVTKRLPQQRGDDTATFSRDRITESLPLDDAEDREDSEDVEDGPGRPAVHDVNIPEEVEEIALGPGGDTVRLSAEMVRELTGQMESRKVEEKLAGKRAEAATSAESDDLPTIGESPTVRTTLPEEAEEPAEETEEDEYVLDDDFSFFTPPPPTRKDIEKLRSPDVIDASALKHETDDSPDTEPGDAPSAG